MIHFYFVVCIPTASLVASCQVPPSRHRALPRRDAARAAGEGRGHPGAARGRAGRARAVHGGRGRGAPRAVHARGLARERRPERLRGCSSRELAGSLMPGKTV